MSLHTFKLEEKLAVVERAIVTQRRFGTTGLNSREAEDQFSVFKALAADIRARLDRPRNLALGDLERGLKKIEETGGDNASGYDPAALIAVGNLLIRHWPFVQQALEHFGAESAE
jgi:hypothetical protein